MPGTGRILGAVILANAGVGILLAIDPPWALWQKVALGAAVGLAADALLHRLTRNL
ncbi:MAG: hypothetical protein H7345_06050 [Rubritepida sp.]|nr:hypothetical protein [Rubritepida sp.]